MHECIIGDAPRIGSGRREDSRIAIGIIGKQIIDGRGGGGVWV